MSFRPKRYPVVYGYGYKKSRQEQKTDRIRYYNRQKKRVLREEAEKQGKLTPVALQGMNYYRKVVYRAEYIQDLELNFLPTHYVTNQNQNPTIIGGVDPMNPIAYAKTIISPCRTNFMRSPKYETFDRIRFSKIEIRYIPTITETTLNIFAQASGNFPNNSYTNLPLVFVYDPTTDVLNGKECITQQTINQGITQASAQKINTLGNKALNALTKNQKYPASLTQEKSQIVDRVITYLHNETGVSGAPTKSALNTDMLYIPSSTYTDSDMTDSGKLFPTCGQLEVVVPYTSLFERPYFNASMNEMNPPRIILRIMFTFVFELIGMN